MIYLVDKTSTGQPFSNWIPTHVYKLWGNYRVANGMLSGFNFGLGMNGQSRTMGNGSASVRQQGGYAVYTAQVGYKFSKNLSLTFTAENLFDKWYYKRIQGNNTYNYYGTPRNYMLTLRHDM
jgi:outer membrane receptor for ferric coprogen and ferric-rhodotorulic acid